MPLTRYQLRNEYSLAEPELYKAADKDDPEALLEGVAMAGLVGVLRQLGDLAEFAAEIFHDLHEEVVATSERGHGLMARVQQLEVEVPSLEKALLSQTNHAPLFTNPGVDWHPNLQTKHNLITGGDMPRCVMDSYEECRAPPRLFLLDKFDVAGAGACLKRYTDPSFYKVDSPFSGVATKEIQREKKIRKGKKKGSRWRNGESPEVVSASRAKLHQLLLEERIENAYNDPGRRVKLRRRQLNASPLDPKSGKSFMEKFLETPSPEHKMVYETSVTPPLLKLASDHSSESGLQIVEIGTVSPVKRASREEKNISSSPNAEELALKPYMKELNRDAANTETVKVPESVVDSSIDEFVLARHDKLRVNKEDADHFDDQTSDVDNYMDALPTMGSEIETDTEFRPKNGFGFLSFGKSGIDSDANDEQLEVLAHYSDRQSVGISYSSDDGNNSFNRGRSSYSFSDTISNPAENALIDNVEAAGTPFTTKNGTSPGDSPESVLADPSGRQDDTPFTTSEKNPVDGLDSGNGSASSKGLLQISNISVNASEKEINSDSLYEGIWTGYSEETGARNSDIQIICSPKPICSPTEEQLTSSTLPESERHTGVGACSEDVSHPMDSSPAHSFDEKQVLLHDPPQVKIDPRESEASCSEKKSDLDEVSEAAETEEIGDKIHEVDTVERGASPLYPDSDTESETETEAVQAEGIAASSADVRASPGSDDVDCTVSQSSYPICSPSNGVLHQEYVAESVTQKERNKEEVALADNEITSRQRPIESSVQNESNQAEVRSYNYSKVEDDISYSSAVENKSSFCVGEETVPAVSSELSDQESGLNSSHERHLKKDTEDDVLSIASNLAEPGIPLEQPVDLQTEPAPENIQLQDENFSPLLLPQLAMRDLESDKQEMNPIVSTFDQLPEATKVNIEEPPPLPPLPPMQWRIGKVQQNSVVSPRELVGQGSFPVTPQYPSEQNAHFGLSAFHGGFLQSGSPFSTFAFVEEEKSRHASEQFVPNLVQPNSFSTNLPVMVNHMNSQYWGFGLDRNHSMNQFLTLPAVQNERPEYVSFATEGQPDDPLIPTPATEYKTSRVDSVYPYETPTQPQNQSGLDAGSEELQSYEEENDNPTYLTVPQSTETHDWVEEDEQPPKNSAEEQQPKDVEEQSEINFVEEQPQHGLVASEGEMEQTSSAFAGLVSEGAWSLHTSSPKQPAEVGKENGNTSVKVPRPRNPLFDAAAALDKSKLRKVTERVLPQNEPKVDERDSLLEQIRTKSFNLRRAAVTRPSLQGPQTNLKVAAILEKANAIRQACAGSDEDDEDSWSDS